MTTSLPPVPGTVPDVPPDNVPLVDQGNPYIGEVPAMMVTDVIETVNGQRIMATFRIPNTTVSISLAKDDAQRWVDQLRRDIARMNGLIIPG